MVTLWFLNFGDQLFASQDGVHDLLPAAQVGDPVLESLALQPLDLTRTLLPDPDLKYSDHDDQHLLLELSGTTR